VTTRFTGEIFNFIVWITVLPRAVGHFLPWVLLAPLIRFHRFRDETDGRVARGLLWGAVVPLVVVSLAPGAAPRYSMPSLAPFCWLMGMVFAENALAEPAWLKWAGRPLFRRAAILFVALAVAAGLIGYPVVAVAAQHGQKVKNIADKINAVVPPNETLYAVDPNYQPFFFYMHSPVKYVSSVEELPWETRYFLVRPLYEQSVAQLGTWAPRQIHQVLRVKDYRNQTVIVFSVDPP
jgi:hypothetical protein